MKKALITFGCILLITTAGASVINEMLGIDFGMSKAEITQHFTGYALEKDDSTNTITVNVHFYSEGTLILSFESDKLIHIKLRITDFKSYYTTIIPKLIQSLGKPIDVLQVDKSFFDYLIYQWIYEGIYVSFMDFDAGTSNTISIVATPISESKAFNIEPSTQK